MKTYQPLTKDRVNSIFGAGMKRGEEKMSFRPAISPSDIEDLTKNGRDSLERGILDSLVGVSKGRGQSKQENYKPYTSLMGLVLSIKSAFFEYEKHIADELYVQEVLNLENSKRIITIIEERVRVDNQRKSKLQFIKTLKRCVESGQISSISGLLSYLEVKERRIKELEQNSVFI